MRRTHLRNKFIDFKTDPDGIAYGKHCNYVSLIRIEKRPISVIKPSGER